MRIVSPIRLLILSCIIFATILLTMPTQVHAAKPTNSCYQLVLNQWVNYGSLTDADCLLYLYQSSTLFGTGYSIGQWDNYYIQVYSSKEVYIKPIGSQSQWEFIGYIVPPPPPTPTSTYSYPYSYGTGSYYSDADAWVDRLNDFGTMENRYR